MDRFSSRSRVAHHPAAVAVIEPVRGRALALLTAFALTLAVLVSGAVTARPAGASTVEDTFAARISQERSSRGIATLTSRPHLVAVARQWAGRMADEARLYHNPRLTSEVKNWRWVGENVGYGPDAATVHAAFMNSPGHRANVLDRDYTEVGVGAVVRDGRVWVAEVFRRPLRVSTSASTGRTGRSSSARTVAVAQRTLHRGSTGAAVRQVQGRLGLEPTGHYGRATEVAVARFQQRQNWSGRGVCGPKTWSRLF